MITVAKCANCTNEIDTILCEMEHTIATLGKLMYIEAIYGIKTGVDKERFKDILQYKDILYRKSFDSSYTCFDVKTIISKAKQYIYG